MYAIRSYYEQRKGFRDIEVVAQRHVMHDGIVQQDGFLGHVTDHAAPGVHVQLLQRHAVEGDSYNFV